MLPELFHLASLLFHDVAPTSRFLAESGLKFKRRLRKSLISGLSANLTSVIESRLSGFMRDLVEGRESSVAFTV